jgi:O-antigen/teichoic acid export membrane protein
MTTNTNARLKGLISQLDVSLLRGSAVITIGTIVARGVGFIGSFLLARFFDPADFGIIQYAFALAAIIAIGTQPLGQHVVARYIGKSKDKPEEVQETLTNIIVILVAIFGLSTLLAVVFLLFTEKFNAGILVIFFGLTIFYAYLGLARGFLASGRFIAADIGSSSLKALMLVIFIGMLGKKFTLLAIFILGLSFLIPPILLQTFWPLEITFDKKLLNKQIAKGIFRFSLPIWLSHASYMIYTTIPLLFLEHYTDNTTVGIFSLAVTLSILFSFFPTGFSTLLMPMIAGASNQRHKTLLANALGITMLANITLLMVYYFIAPWMVGLLFGRDYLAFPSLFILMAIVATFVGAHGIFTSVFVGKDRAQEETKSRLVVVVVTVMGCWLLTPTYGALGAAWASLLGIICGLTVYGVVFKREGKNE